MQHRSHDVGSDPAALKSTVRALLDLPPSTPVLVSELRCPVADRPMGTVIAVLPDRSRGIRWTLRHPLAELDYEILRTALTIPLEVDQLDVGRGLRLRGASSTRAITATAGLRGSTGSGPCAKLRSPVQTGSA